MYHNPLIQRYRASLLRPRQIGMYAFMYGAIVIIILLLNYTVFTTFKPLIFPNGELPFDPYQAIFYQFACLQVLVLWVWASYNSGSALTIEILQKSYIFFKLLPITALQKAFGVLFGANLVTYPCAALTFLILTIFAILGKMNGMLVYYYFLLFIAVAAFLNTLTLLLSINPDVKKRRRIGMLAVIGFVMWVLMGIMARLFASGTRVSEIENIRLDFFGMKISGFFLCSLMLFYFTGWMILGILRKFRHEREALFSTLGSTIFLVGFEILTTGLFWSFLHLRNIFYIHRALSLWALMFVNLGALSSVEKYFELGRKLSARTPSAALNLLRLFRHSTCCWGGCLFGIWTAFFIGLSGIPGVSFSESLFPLLNLFGFALFFMGLLEILVLYQHLRNIKIFLSIIALITLMLPLMLFHVLENEMVYLHSLLGYLGNLITPFLVKGGGAAIQWRVFIVNLLLSALPFFLIVKNYLRFVKASSER